MIEYNEYSLDVFSLLSPAMEGRVLSHGDKTATKETITDCEIVYNPVLSCVKLAKL